MRLYDRTIASTLATARIQTAADAERLAAENKSVRRDQRFQRSNNNFFPKGEKNYLEEDFEPDEYLDKEEDDITAAVGVLGPSQRNETSLNKPPDRRRAVAISTTKCKGCGQYGHFRSEFHRPQRLIGKRFVQSFASRTPVDCLLCKGNHVFRNCSSLASAQRFVSKNETDTPRQSDTSKMTVFRSIPVNSPNEQNALFKRDGTAVLQKKEQSPVHMFDFAIPAMSEESTPGTPRKKLFFVLGAVQTLPVWILADYGLVRNLIDEAVYRRLPFQSSI